LRALIHGIDIAKIVCALESESVSSCIVVVPTSLMPQMAVIDISKYAGKAA
jgi:hypothetical protein